MINKKLSKTLGPILGIMAFMFASGATCMPAFAADTTTTTTTTTTAAVNYTDSTASTQPKDYSVAINKSVEQNGIKVTVDSALATKHNLRVVLKIESNTELKSFGRGSSLFEVSYGSKDSGFGRSSSRQYLDNKTMLLTLEKDNYEGLYPESGNLRVDVVLSDYKVNIGMDIPVDFTNSINNIFEKNIDGTIPQLNYTLNKLESDSMGTTIAYTEPKQDEETMADNDTFWDSIILLKNGDKYYKLQSRGESMGDSDTITGHYQSKLPTYDTIKDEKDISILPISYEFPSDEAFQYNGKENTTTDSAINITYQKDLTFADGSKGTIYGIERNDNSIKVYCKGETDFESLLMASSIDMNYKYVKGQKDSIYYRNDCTSFYKDPKDSFGYIVEFDNVQKDKAANLTIDPTIKQSDTFKLGNEIKLSN